MNLFMRHEQEKTLVKNLWKPFGWFFRCSGELKTGIRIALKISSEPKHYCPQPTCSFTIPAPAGGSTHPAGASLFFAGFSAGRGIICIGNARPAKQI
jgi:hypothetical protein